MTIVIVLAVGLLVVVVSGAALAAPSSPQQRDVEKLHQRVQAADQQIQADYRQARRAMNEAAGQSWRNLVD